MADEVYNLFFNRFPKSRKGKYLPDHRFWLTEFYSIICIQIGIFLEIIINILVNLELQGHHQSLDVFPCDDFIIENPFMGSMLVYNVQVIAFLGQQEKRK